MERLASASFTSATALLAAVAPSYGAVEPDPETLAASAAEARSYAEVLALLDAWSDASPGDVLAHVTRRGVWQRTLGTEDVLCALARELHNSGCPSWRLAYTLKAVSAGMGLAGVSVHAFPNHITFTFSRLLSGGHGAKTLTVSTTPGLCVAALYNADALCRRIASYAATPSAAPGAPPPAAANGACPDESLVVAAAASLAARRAPPDPGVNTANTVSTLPVLRPLPPRSAADLAAATLDAASSGPGFFLCASPVDGEEEAAAEPEPWAKTDGGGGEEGSSKGLGGWRAEPLAPNIGGGGGGDNADAEEGSAPPSPREDPPPLHHRRRAAFLACALRDAGRRLAALGDGSGEPYSSTATVAASAAAAAGSAIVFWSGSAWDGAVAGGCGALVAALGIILNSDAYGGRRAGLRRAAGYELLAATLVSLATRAALQAAADGRAPRVCVAASRLGALQWLLQGYDITISLVELTQRRALVGASHLATALMITALIGFGLDLGDVIADGLGLAVTSGSLCSAGVRPAFLWLAMVPTAGGLCVLMGATVRQSPPLFVVAYAAYAVSSGIELSSIAARLGTLIGAVATGFLANAHASLTGRPALALAAMGTFILVPDGMAEVNGVSAIFSLSHTSTRTALRLSATVAQAAVTIAAGLFLSTLALQPRDFDYVVYDREAFEAEAASRWWGARLLRRARDALAPAPRQRRGAYIKNRPPVAYF